MAYDFNDGDRGRIEDEEVEGSEVHKYYSQHAGAERHTTLTEDAGTHREVDGDRVPDDAE